MKYDVLLKHIVISKGAVSPLKRMNVPEPHVLEELIAKSLEVWAVAEAARCDGDKLAAAFEEALRWAPESGEACNGLGLAFDARNGADIDDVAASFQQTGQSGPAQIERSVQVDRQILCPVVVGHRLRPAHLMPSGDVDENV